MDCYEGKFLQKKNSHKVERGQAIFLDFVLENRSRKGYSDFLNYAWRTKNLYVFTYELC